MRVNVETKILQVKGGRFFDPRQKAFVDDLETGTVIKIHKSKFLQNRKLKSSQKVLATIVDMYDDEGNHTKRHIFLLAQIPNSAYAIEYNPHLDRFDLKYSRSLDTKTKEKIDKILHVCNELDKSIRHTYALEAKKSLEVVQ